MRKFLSLILFLAILALGVSAQAASKSQTAPVAKAGQEVQTPFFQITIPEGWMMPQDVRDMPNDAVAAIFATVDKKVAVTITAMTAQLDAKTMTAQLDAKTMAEQTVANMRKGGMTTDNPVQKGEFYVVDMRPKAAKDPKAMGRSIFGSNGKVCTVTTITGTDMAVADPLLAAIKPLQGAIFPTTAE